jgi:predicted nucleic acid-binding protein
VILVDTSIWIDHLHASEPALVDALAADEVGHHPLVAEELAMGRLERRMDVLRALRQLRPFPQLSHQEFTSFVEAERLWGRGLGPVDAHLLGSVRLVPGSVLWSRDRRLVAAARDLGQAVRD